MYIRVLILVVVLFLNGCGKTDIDELKALNSSSDQNSSHEINKTKTVEKMPIMEQNTTKIIEQNMTATIEQNITKEVFTTPLIKALTKEEREYKLAIEEIKKEMALTNADSNFKLSLTELENQKERDLKTAELSLAKVAMQNNLELSKIELQKAQEQEKTKQLLQKEEHQKDIEIAKTEQVVEEKKEQNKALQIQESSELYKIAAAITGILLLLSLLIIYLLKRRKEENIAKAKEAELKQKMQFKIMEEQSKNLDKMLEIIKSKEVSENVEKEILSTIKESQKKTLTFEERPRKSLIFRR